MIYVGLDRHETRILSWGHNIDNDYQEKMTLIQKVSYIHICFSKNNEEKTPKLKRYIAYEIQVKGIEMGDI